MLSRTADSLFWMARYVERAENMARLVDMGRRMALIPGGAAGRRNEWPAVLSAAGVAHRFAEVMERTPAETPQREIVAFMILDRANPSSVASCFEQARANARSARSALTRDMWETLNDAWIEARRLERDRLENGAVSPLIDWVKSVSAKFRGATDGSALRDDGFEFLRLGHYIERMDNVARLLDVKAGSMAQEGDQAVDQYAWVSILVAGGVLRAYHFAYRADHDPAKIARFMIRDTTCPRSLSFCAERVTEHLLRLSRLYGEAPKSLEAAQEQQNAIDAIEIEDLLNGDLHRFLTDLIWRNNRLALTLAEDYHFSPPPAAAKAKAAVAPSPSPAYLQTQVVNARLSQSQVTA